MIERYLSVCSGIEAATVAFEPLGWKPLAFSEIDPFPRAVLQHHYPEVPLYGDFTKLRDEPWIVDADMLVGGTPCQAFSVAGLRQSLDDDRGNLTLEYVRLANAIDDLRRDAGRPPVYCCWENVPGVLSTHDNAFGAFLAGLCGCDAPLVSPREYGWSDAGVVAGPKRWAAWRILDAQYHGLAQRRRRVFVLSQGGAGGWRCADALLPIVESVRWNPPPRREAGKGSAPTLSARTKGGGGLGTDFDLDGGLIAGSVSPTLAQGTGGGCGHLYRQQGNEDALVVTSDVAATLTRGAESSGKGGYAGRRQEDDDNMVARCVTARQTRIDWETETFVPMSPLSFDCKAGANTGFAIGEIPSSLRGEGHGGGHSAIAFHENQRGELTVKTVAGSLKVGGGKPGQGSPAVMNNWRVRRLTPTECERLQGFEDSYTFVPYRGREASDGPRYKALGNSMAVNCMRWIGTRIQMIEDMAKGRQENRGGLLDLMEEA